MLWWCSSETSEDRVKIDVVEEPAPHLESESPAGDDDLVGIEVIAKPASHPKLEPPASDDDRVEIDVVEEQAPHPESESPAGDDSDTDDAVAGFRSQRRQLTAASHESVQVDDDLISCRGSETELPSTKTWRRSMFTRMEANALVEEISSPSEWSVTAIFVYGFRLLISLGNDEKALRVLTQNIWIAIALLIMSIAFPLADTYTDVHLTYDWLKSDDDFWYGKISLAILCVHPFVTAFWMLAVESKFGSVFWHAKAFDFESGMFHPILGFVLTVTQLRLPFTALLQIFDVWHNGVHDKYMTTPVKADQKLDQNEFLRRFTRGYSGLLMLKMYELLGESMPEMLLQTFKLAIDFFDKDIMPDALLVGSILVGLCTFSFGVTGMLLNREQLATRLLATLYFLTSLVARVAVLIVLFIEFGKWTITFVVFAFVARVFMTYSRVNPRYGETGVFLLFGIFDYVLLLFLPLGSKVAFGSAIQRIVTLNGVSVEPLVEDKLTSPWALRNFVLTLAENAVGWMCVFFVDFENIPHFGFFALFGILPMVSRGASREPESRGPARERRARETRAEWCRHGMPSVVSADGPAARQITRTALTWVAPRALSAASVGAWLALSRRRFRWSKYLG